MVPRCWTLVRHVESHPFAWRMLLRDVTGDPDIEAQHAELHRDQVAADVELLRLVRPPLPAEQLEPLGEVVRSGLVGLALWWLDAPQHAPLAFLSPPCSGSPAA